MRAGKENLGQSRSIDNLEINPVKKYKGPEEIKGHSVLIPVEAESHLEKPEEGSVWVARKSFLEKTTEEPKDLAESEHFI